MTSNIINTIKGYLTEDFSKTLASKLGESESGTVKAITASLPIILGSVFGADKTNSGILGKLKNLSGNSILGNLKGLVGDNDKEKSTEELNTVLSSLFGDDQNKIIHDIASHSGVKESSAKQILTVTSAAALGSLGHHATVNNLGESEFFSFLNSQKTNISAITPPNLNLAALGLGNLNVNTKSTIDYSAAKTTAKNAAQQHKKSNNSKLIPLLLLLSGLILAYFCYQSCNKSSITGTSVADTINKDLSNKIADGKIINATTVNGNVDSLGNYVYHVGEMVTIELPNGAGVMKAGENSTEVKLVNFLKSNELVDTGKGNWFDFTNVRFKTGSSEITDESLIQLKNMVIIAKAFPNAQFKIGGYTDNTGEEITNVSLSKNRAAVVAKKIIALGSSAKSIIKSDGYGSQFPIGDNTTEAGKAQNRRVSLNVKAK